MPRFYDPTEGIIEIDGYDIKKVKIKSLRNTNSNSKPTNISF